MSKKAATVHTKDHYDDKYYEANHQSGDRIALRFFAKILKRYCKKGTILEYGCGSGFFIKKFDTPEYQRIAYDISDYAMEQTRKNNPGIITVENTEKEIKRASVDAVAALHLLEHIEDPSVVLKEFNRMLKDKGIVFATVPNMSSVGRQLKGNEWFAYRDETHISLLYPHEWYRLFEKAGFEVIKQGSDGLWDVPYLGTKVPSFLQKLLFYPTSAIQIIAGTVFLPIRSGENLILVARKVK